MITRPWPVQGAGGGGVDSSIFESYLTACKGYDSFSDDDGDYAGARWAAAGTSAWAVQPPPTLCTASTACTNLLLLLSMCPGTYSEPGSSHRAALPKAQPCTTRCRHKPATAMQPAPAWQKLAAGGLAIKG